MKVGRKKSRTFTELCAAENESLRQENPKKRKELTNSKVRHKKLKSNLFSGEKLNEQYRSIVEEEFEGQHAQSRDSSSYYIPIEVQEDGGYDGEGLTQSQRYKREMHLLENRMNDRDSEMRDLLERERMKCLKI